MKFLNEIDGSDKLKQDSNNRLVTDEQIANWNSKSVVNIGMFNDQTELITHVVMNQLPTGHYTLIMDGYPYFMLLRQWSDTYDGTLYTNDADFVYFNVTIYGEIVALKSIDLRDLCDVGDLVDVRVYVDSQDELKADKTYVDSQDELKADKTYVDSQDELKADKTYVDSQDLKQMPISGGVLENYREKLVTVNAENGSVNLNLGNVFQHTPSFNTLYTITNPVSGVAHSFTLIINIGANPRTLTFPASVKWQGGEIPDLTATNKTYVLTFMTVDGGTNWLGMFGGEF